MSRDGLWKIMSKFGRTGSWRMSDSFMMGWWTMFLSMKMFWSVSGVQWSETRLLPWPNAVQSDVLGNADRCVQGDSQGDPQRPNQVRTGATERCSSSCVYRPSLKSKRLWSVTCALLMNVPSMPSMTRKHNKDAFSSACENFGLTISTKNSAVMYQPAPRKPYQKPYITAATTPSRGEFHPPRQHFLMLCQQGCRSQHPHCKGKQGLWEIEEVILGTKSNIRVHKDQSVQSSRLNNTSLWPWNLDHLQQTWETSPAVPSLVSPQHSQHPLARQDPRYWDSRERRPPQRHYHHSQSSDTMGRAR